MSAGLLALLALVFAPKASADITFCGVSGPAAGQCDAPNSVAVDLDSGIVYVADERRDAANQNNRIDLFSEAGVFAKAFGWDVIPTGQPGDTGAGLEVCSTATTCKAASVGGGAGQFNRPSMVAVDNSCFLHSPPLNESTSPTCAEFDPADGDVYLFDRSNARLQRFDAEGDFLRLWGWDVVASGPNDDTSLPPNEFEVCVDGVDVCKAGIAGGGVGQFESSAAVQVAVGPNGTVFVADKNHTQMFSPEGSVITNCSSITTGGLTNGVAAAPDGSFYVASNFSPAGVRKFDSACTLLNTFHPSANINAIAVDATGNLFVADSTGFPEIGAPVYQYNSAGNPIRTLYGNGTLEKRPISLAPYSNATGDLFVVESSSPRRLAHIKIEPPGPVVLPFETKASPIGNVTATFKAKANPEGKESKVHFEFVDDDSYGNEGGFASPNTNSTAESASIGSDFKDHETSAAVSCPEPEVELATKIEDGECLAAETLYHLRAVATNADAPGGRPGEEITFETQPPVQLGPLWSTSVGADSARLHAELNPTGIPAKAHFEYVEEAAYQQDIGEGGDGFASAVQTSSLDFGSGSSMLARSVLVFPLQPGTTYRYRYVASDFFGAFPSPVRAFTTPEVVLPPQTDCPNQAFRIGSAANLPDCRAYELVSPLEKEGGDILAPPEITKIALGQPLARIAQADPEGEGLTYASYRGIGDAQSVPYSSEYLARRDGENGWLFESVNAPREGPSLLHSEGGAVVELLFSAFTEDLCSAWLIQDADLALAPGAPAGVPTLYRRENCDEGAGEYELLSSAQPPGFSKEVEKDSSYFPTLGGFSEDGSAAAFKAPAVLTPEAATVPVGEKLSCLTPGETVTYQWLRNGAVIGGKTEPTYTTIAPQDQGKAIQCRVSASNEGITAIAVSNPAQIVAPLPASGHPVAPPVIHAPTSSAPLVVGGGGGQTLSCDAREVDWEGAPLTFSYQWLRNGTAIGTDSPTYLTTAPNLATVANFQCAVSAANADGVKVTKVSRNLLTTPSPAAPRLSPRVLDVYRAYLAEEGSLRLISVLPGGQAAATHSSVGTALFVPGKRIFDSVEGAFAADGARVFWSAQIEDPSAPAHVSDGTSAKPSRLYLRLNPAQEQSALDLGSALGTGDLASGSNVVTGVVKTSTGAFGVGQTIAGEGIPLGTTIAGVGAGTLTLSANATANGADVPLEAFGECTEAEKACTLQLSGGKAIFRAADPAGTKALFSEGEELYELDVEKAANYEAGARTLLAGGVKGLLGASEDLARVYLVSAQDLDGGGPATAGDFNLYLREAGVGFSFVAELLSDGWASEPPPGEPSASSDVRSISPFPVNRSSRVGEDGLHAAFMSDSSELAELTAGYDNTDAASGEADSEVYLYDAVEEALRCVSCNPSGGRPLGAPLKPTGAAKEGVEAWAAARIPGWETQWYPSRVLSGDGERLFFESFEGLVSRDTNGKRDVYEWERADSRAECEELGAERFAASAGGCLSLISSGVSSGESEFLDASASGSDVFFTTASSLLPQDYGLIDVYDAREGGGFPVPEPPSPPCEGEACQSPPAPPDDPTPASATFAGQGNVVEPTKRKAKAKAKKHKRQKKHKGKNKRKRNKHRRAGR